MKNFNSFFRINTDFLFCSLKTFVLVFPCLTINAQDCPKNIDFENGTFQGWTCYVGFVIEQNSKNLITLGASTQPANNRHTIYSSNPGNGLDPYGHFPINCPNGSGHSVRLGNDEGGAWAEGISYEFTIPTNKNLFKIIYHYAIVFQESPHLEYQQPRFEIEVTNVTRNSVISCSSFEFRPFGPLLPGFELSDKPINNVPIWIKEWTPVSINLNGHAGETIRLFFKTADCTYFDHFGYAYIDVESECNGEFAGAKYCADDTLVNLVAPSGFQNYTWYNNTFTQMLGTNQTINLSPQAALGAATPVVVIPYFSNGCIDTFYAKVTDTLIVNANAGPDKISCNNDSVLIGGSSLLGLSYSWKPSLGLSNAAVSNPLANPNLPTTYTLTVNSIGGGCIDYDTIFVNTSFVSDSLQVIGKLDYCLGSGDTLILRVQHADSIQWFRDNSKINGANQQQYKPIQSGTYYAALFNKDGCSAITSKKIVHIDHAKQGINYPVKYTLAGTAINLAARNFGDNLLWKPSFNLNDPNIISPVFTGNSDQLYTIDIKTNSECTTVDTQFVKIISHSDIYVPTAFTPNHDGLNDILRPVLIGIKEFHFFKVFNRWGELLFETKSPGPGWDGKIKTTLASTQSVVWMAEGVGLDNKIYFRKGVSTILR
jgi:gliding motility-associated-like protein